MGSIEAYKICLEASLDHAAYCEVVYEQALKKLLKLQGCEILTAAIRDAHMAQQQSIINTKKLMIEVGIEI